MYERDSKRKLRIKLTFTYAAMILTTLGLLVVAVFIAQGYRFNSRDGKIEQGGMIQFDSIPNGAEIQLDTVKLANRTPTRITATAGNHTVTVSRDGYAPWQKQVAVKPGSVLWLNYIRFVPLEPKTATAATFSGLSSAAASLSRERFALISDEKQPAITFIKVNDSSVDRTTVNLDENSYTAPAENGAQSFSLLGWDKESKRVIVKHAYDDSAEYIVAALDGTAQNITKQFGVSIAKFYFDPTDSQAAYVLTATREIRRLNLSAATLSGPLVSNASDLTVAYNGWVGFATHTDESGARTVGYVSKGKLAPITVQTFSDQTDKSLGFAIGRYYNEMYHLVVTGDHATIYKGDMPESDAKTLPQFKTIAKLSLAENVAHAGFSPHEQRFVYVQNGRNIVTYDLELSSIATVSSSAALQTEVAWLDSHHLLSVAGGVVEFADYDGTNTQTLAHDAVSTAAFVSTNNKYFYYFAAGSDSEIRLVRLSMTTEK